MATTTSVRALVRKDLHDEDSANYRWTDAVLDRHVQRAVSDLSLAMPLEQRTTLTTTAASRDISIAGLTNLIQVEALEWPVGSFPPERRGFSVWSTTLTIDSVNAPAGVENVYVYWTKTHTLDGSSSTYPAAYDELVTLGAAGYAALDWTSYASNRINIGGDDTWGRYKAFADERMQTFRAELARLGRANTVRQRRMYSADAPSIFEQSRVKY